MPSWYVCILTLFLLPRKGDAIIRCVEEALLSRCEDPTPSNLLHGLLTAMRTATPCSAVSSSPAPARYSVELQTKVHTKVCNHGEGPY